MNYYKGLIKIGENGDFKGVPSSLIKAYIADFTLELYTRKQELKKMHSRFKNGDIVICLLKGGGYGDKFTVLEDTGGLTLLCHKTGSMCIVNNREDYEYYNLHT
jgi:hypothetical protein